jgi:hypothetical protein
MVTVSSELWQAGTMPGGQRCLHSSQVKPVSRAGLRGWPSPSPPTLIRETLPGPEALI